MYTQHSSLLQQSPSVTALSLRNSQQALGLTASCSGRAHGDCRDLILASDGKTAEVPVSNAPPISGADTPLYNPRTCMHGSIRANSLIALHSRAA